uniref:Uncharacterized protein n=1 Tax=Podarcis muralis TaxID=64176 RepID=A0A670JNG0_PODMU
MGRNSNKRAPTTATQRLKQDYLRIKKRPSALYTILRRSKTKTSGSGRKRRQKHMGLPRYLVPNSGTNTAMYRTGKNKSLVLGGAGRGKCNLGQRRRRNELRLRWDSCFLKTGSPQNGLVALFLLTSGSVLEFFSSFSLGFAHFGDTRGFPMTWGGGGRVHKPPVNGKI